MTKDDVVFYAICAVGALFVFAQCVGDSSSPGYPEDCIVEYWATGPECM